MGTNKGISVFFTFNVKKNHIFYFTENLRKKNRYRKKSSAQIRQKIIQIHIKMKGILYFSVKMLENFVCGALQHHISSKKMPPEGRRFL